MFFPLIIAKPPSGGFLFIQMTFSFNCGKMIQYSGGNYAY
ncbi:hypothetical protein [Escherichia phage UPEC06]|nr:hypothetical protein [Escherichia phage UPEC06]